MEVTYSDIVATLAFAFTVGLFIRQRKHDRQVAWLNSLLIEKEEAENLSANRADLYANFVKVGKGSYQFRIHNRGKGAAQNIQIEILEGRDLFADDDLKRKFPYPSLEMHQPINLMIYLSHQSSLRAKVRLRWEDGAGGGTKEITDDVI